MTVSNVTSYLQVWCELRELLGDMTETASRGLKRREEKERNRLLKGIPFTSPESV